MLYAKFPKIDLFELKQFYKISYYLFLNKNSLPFFTKFLPLYLIISEVACFFPKIWDIKPVSIISMGTLATENNLHFAGVKPDDAIILTLV